MLPTGHLATGYLTTKFAIDVLVKFYPHANQPRFWIVGLLAAVIVDLDDFYAFIKIGRPIGATKDVDHRKFISHAPFLHLWLAVLVFAIAAATGSSDWQLYSGLYLVGMWTHFFFDSFGYGIMWLWPFRLSLYAFYRPNVRLNVSEDLPFIKYWTRFIIEYFKDWVFYFELAMILMAVLVYFGS